MSDYDQPVSENDPLGFYARFLYPKDDSEGQGADICTRANSTKITIEQAPGMKSVWSVERMNSPTVGTCWKFCPNPGEKIALRAHDSIIFRVGNILCNNIPGNPPMYVKLNKDQEKQASLYKIDKPVIESFQCTSKDYDLDDLVQMKWKITNALGWHVWINGMEVEDKKTEVLVRAEDKPYFLRVKHNQAAYVAESAPVQLTFTFIEKFEMDCNYPLALKWKVRNVSNVTISCFDGQQEFQGSRRPERDGDITLEAIQKYSTIVHKKTLDFRLPVIKNFTASKKIFSPIRVPDGADTFLSMEEILAEKDNVIYSKMPDYDPPDPPIKFMTVYAVWDTENVTNCRLNFINVPAKQLTAAHYEMRDSPRVTLMAYSKYGYIEKEVNV